MNTEHRTFSLNCAAILAVQFMLLAASCLQPANAAVVAWGLGDVGQTNVPSNLGNVTSIAAGRDHSLALKADGTVITWGDNSFGQTNPPPNMNRVKAIAAGGWHSLALLDNGTVLAWGDSTLGQTYVPDRATNVVAIAAGRQHSLALRSDGKVVAWGDDSDGQTAPPSDLGAVIAIGAGGFHSVALRLDGTVVAWGNNWFGQTNVPQGLSNVVSVAVGAFLSLALRRDGTVIAWGDDTSGQRSFFAGLSNLLAIAAGQDHSLAQKFDGSVIGGGDNTSGQLDFPGTLTNVVRIAAGDFHNLALVEPGAPTMKPVFLGPTFLTGKVGQPFSFQIAAANSPTNYSASGLPPGLGIVLTNGLISGVPTEDGLFPVLIYAANEHGTGCLAMTISVAVGAMPLEVLGPTNLVADLGLLLDVPMSAQGNPIWYGVAELPSGLGVNSTNGVITGIPLVAGVFPLTLSVSNQDGSASADGIIRVRSLLSWGNNDFGQGEDAGVFTNAVQIAGGYSFSLALMKEGTVRTWGASEMISNAPVALTNIVAIAAGFSHALALRSDGTVVAWSDKTSAIELPPGLNNVVSIAAGYHRSLALRAGGEIIEWGAGTSVKTNIAGASAVATGENHNLALCANGTVAAWGTNSQGQINVPPGMSNVVAIAAGANHNLALQANGTVVAWGNNAHGQTNVPFGLNNVVAIAAGAVHSLALQANGNLAAWGGNFQGLTNVPPVHGNVRAIAAGAYHNLALLDAVTNARPVFIGPPATVGAIGRFFHYQIQARNVPARFGAEGLPTGLTIDPATGIITGTPTQAGSHDVTLYATNENGISQSELTIDIGLTVPAITSDRIIRVNPWLPFIYEVTANNEPDLVGVQGLPAWMQWDQASATLTGIPPGLASDTVTLLASNQYGIGTAELRIETSPIIVWGNNNSGQRNLPSNLSQPIAIAAGQTHLLAINGGGQAVAWGDDARHQTEVPFGLAEVVSIAGGLYHSVALKADQTVVAWGSYQNGQTNVPPGLSKVISVSAGWFHNVALRSDGSVVAWGDNLNGQTNVPVVLGQAIAVAAGGLFSLALKPDGTVAGWGDIVVPPGISNVAAMAAGDGHVLLLHRDGSVTGFGGNSSGQLDVPGDLTNVVAIAAGTDHSLALRTDGTVVGWGGNSQGQIAPPSGLTNALAIAAGNGFSVALLDARQSSQPPQVISSPFCRGMLGQTFQFRVMALNQPVTYGASNLPPGLTIDTASGLISGAATDGGSFAAMLYATNAAGVAARQLKIEIGLPIPVITSGRFAPAYPGVSFRYQVAADNSPTGFDAINRPAWLVWDATNGVLSGLPPAFGSFVVTLVASNQYGTTTAPLQLEVLPIAAWGRGSEGQTTVPFGISNVVAISGGFQQSLALTAAGKVMAWGAVTDPDRQVINGLSNIVAISASLYHNLAMTEDGLVTLWGKNWFNANLPPGLSNIVGISAGYRHNLFLRADGGVVASGDNWYGQGIVPKGITNVVAIAAGGTHNLALRADGTVVAWGDNSYGQTNVVPGLSNVVAIAAGGTHNLVLRADGTVAAWGDSSNGQTELPPGLTNIVGIAANGFHSLALRADGTLLAWGYNTFGQTNVPVWLTNVVAVAAGTLHSLAMIGNDPDVSRPVLINPRYSLGAFGQPYFYRLIAKNQPTGLGASGLPPGLSFSPATGLITGTPTESGIYDVILAATNAAGTTTQNLRMRINGPPGIKTQPQDQTVVIGAAVSFAITFSGVPPLQFQWRKNGENIPGATNAILTIPIVQVPDGGSYSVVVANDYGAVVSAPARLIVRVADSVPPVNDNFTNRWLLTGLQGQLAGTNAFASREPGEPYHANKESSNSVWFTWQAPVKGIATFKTVGSTFDTLLAVYQGDTLEVLHTNVVASDEDKGGYFTSEVRFNVFAGARYEIAVDGFAEDQGHFILQWFLEPTDDIVPVITNQPISRMVMAGTNSTFLVGVDDKAGNLQYQWYFNNTSLSGATNASLLITNVQRDRVGYYRVAVTNVTGRGVESLPAGLEIGPTNDVYSLDKFEDMLSTLTPRPLGLRSGFGSTFGLSVTVGWMVSPVFSTADSTTQARETNGLVTISGASRWFTVLSQGDGTMVFDTTGSDFDTVMILFGGPANSIRTAVWLGSDDNGATDGLHSRLKLPATNGQVFYASVDGKDGVTGIAQLNSGLGLAPQSSNVLQNLVFQSGQNAHLVAATNGAPAPLIQWYKDGVVMWGATNAALDLAGLGVWDIGDYYVLLSNFVDSVWVPVARLESAGQMITLAASRFDFGLEGWYLANGTGVAITNLTTSGGQGKSLAVVSTSGGSGLWPSSLDLRLPADFMGNQGSAYGGLLKFDLSQSTNANGALAARVYLSGGGLTVAKEVARKPGTNWVTYRLVLHEFAGWRKSDETGPWATRDELLAALRGLSAITIRIGAAAIGKGLLDNVELQAIVKLPDPVVKLGLTESKAILLEWPGILNGFQLNAASELSPDAFTNVINATIEYDPATRNHRALVPVEGAHQYFRLKQ